LGEKLYTQLYRVNGKVNPFWHQYRELEKTKLRKQFYASIIHENDLCFDVGANYGNRVSAFLHAKARVVAVEPQKECCDFLEKKYGKRIIIINKGLGTKEETKEFYISNISSLSTFSNEWINTVEASSRFENSTWERKEIVALTTLDKLIEYHGIPAFIKIDVEGYELEVLSGLTKPVRMISFEYTVPERIDTALQCLQRILCNNNSIECNYSVREHMRFELSKWISVQDMQHLIQSPEFIATSAGDIYIRTV